MNTNENMNETLPRFDGDELMVETMGLIVIGTVIVCTLASLLL